MAASENEFPLNIFEPVSFQLTIQEDFLAIFTFKQFQNTMARFLCFSDFQFQSLPDHSGLDYVFAKCISHQKHK